MFTLKFITRRHTHFDFSAFSSQLVFLFSLWMCAALPRSASSSSSHFIYPCVFHMSPCCFSCHSLPLSCHSQSRLCQAMKRDYVMGFLSRFSFWATWNDRAFSIRVKHFHELKILLVTKFWNFLHTSSWQRLAFQTLKKSVYKLSRLNQLLISVQPGKLIVK